MELNLYYVISENVTNGTCPTGPDIPVWMEPKSSFTDEEYQALCQGYTEIPSDIPEDTKQLKIHGNEIPVLGAYSFKNLLLCTDIDLAWNNIKFMESQTFDGLKSVHNVGIENNNLTFLPYNAFGNLPSIRSISLNYNKLQKVQTGAFTGCGSLTELFMESNNLTGLHYGMLQGLQSLNKLVVSFNEISSIDLGVFRNLPALWEIRLDHNNLTVLKPGSFQGIQYMTALYLNHNKLKVLQQGVLGGFPIGQINLSYNALQTLEEGSLSDIPILMYLSLTANKLSDFPWTLFKPDDYSRLSTNPLYIQLSENPLSCGRSLCWLQQGQADGWLHWLYRPNGDYIPRCSNCRNRQLTEVKIDCPSKGEYPELFFVLW